MSRPQSAKRKKKKPPEKSFWENAAKNRRQNQKATETNAKTKPQEKIPPPSHSWSTIQADEQRKTKESTASEIKGVAFLRKGCHVLRS